MTIVNLASARNIGGVESARHPKPNVALCPRGDHCERWRKWKGRGLPRAPSIWGHLRAQPKKRIFALVFFNSENGFFELTPKETFFLPEVSS